MDGIVFNLFLLHRRTKSITEESLVSLRLFEIFAVLSRSTNKQLPLALAKNISTNTGLCRALSDAAERTASVGEGGKEERRVYAAIYKRDYYVNNVDGNDNDVDYSSTGDEDETPQKKVNCHI